MRTKITITLLLLPIVLSAGVTPGAKKAFENKYPTYDDVWWDEDENGNHVAYFILEGQEKKAVFKAFGEWLQTTTEMDVEALPKCVTKYLDSNYQSQVPFSAIIYEDPKVMNRLQVMLIPQGEVDSKSDYDDTESDWEWGDDEEVTDAVDHLTVHFDECKFIKHEQTKL